MAAMFRYVQHKPMIHGLIEVDVTRARAHLREHKATTGESLSFTAFLIACLAKAVDEHKAVQACRKGSKHLILRSEEHTSELQSRPHLVCRLLLEKKNEIAHHPTPLHG